MATLINEEEDRAETARAAIEANRILVNARAQARSLPGAMRFQADKQLDVLLGFFSTMASRNLPVLSSRIDNNGALAIAWVPSPAYRFGLAFESDTSKSGWHFTTPHKFDSGFLAIPHGLFRAMSTFVSLVPADATERAKAAT